MSNILRKQYEINKRYKYNIKILSPYECIHEFLFIGTRKELYNKVNELQSKNCIIRKIKELEEQI